MSTIAIILGTLATSVAAIGAPHLDVSPASALVDRPIAIRATGLAPSRPATISLETSGPRGERWRSTVRCDADTRGSIDLRSCNPGAGSSYTTVDGMGLFWSMRPVDHPAAGYFPTPRSRTTTYTLTLDDGSGAAASREIVRETWSSDVRSAPAPAPFVGTYFTRANAGRRPAILVLGGSEGGHALDPVAALLASHGYTTLSLAYFSAPGLPQALAGVPLETAVNALGWLAKQPEVDPARVAVWGISKGGEYALLAATRTTSLKAVVAVVPSAYSWFGLEFTGAPTSSWSEAGAAVPFILPDPQSGAAIGQAFSNGGDVRYRDVYEASLRAAPADQIARATIPVERIMAPVLFVCGEDDREWDSCGMTHVALDRMHRSARPFHDQTFSYPNAGHAIGVPYLPTLGFDAFPSGKARIVLGGTPAGDAAAAEASWPKELDFLAAALHP